MRRNVWFIAGGVSIALVVATGLAAAATPPDRPSDSAHPAIAKSGGVFYSEAQADEVWRAVTTAYPSALPAGVFFSAEAPSFFHPDDGRESLFQEGLPELAAARYWRCAWLGTLIHPNAAPDAGTVTLAVAKLSEYRRLPGVGEHIDVDEYESKMSEYAHTLGVDPHTAEYQAECSGGSND